MRGPDSRPPGEAAGSRSGSHLGSARSDPPVAIEAYKAALYWRRSLQDGLWRFAHSPATHYHLICSKKKGHPDRAGNDDRQMKFFRMHLPEVLRQIVVGTAVAEEQFAGGISIIGGGA